MGIINITPDSFSDGGSFLQLDKALARAHELISDGADILDLGPQSTRPGAHEIGPDEEIKRLSPILLSIKKAFPEILISVDTFHSEVATFALNNGAKWVNNVTGGRRDPRILEVISESGCPFVLTHSRGNSLTMDKLANYTNVVLEVRDSLLRKTELALNIGVKPEQIILDPGLGFAKTHEQNILLIKDIDIICRTGFPVLIGPSRKRFIGHIIHEDDPLKRIWGTVAIACKCVERNVDIIRVHDVKPILKTILMAKRIWD